MLEVLLDLCRNLRYPLLLLHDAFALFFEARCLSFDSFEGFRKGGEEIK